jgi:hypothetical protein
MAVDDQYTKSLLHMDTVGTTFTDESGKTWTTSGSAKINTTSYKFGGASGSFSGTGTSDYISTGSSTDFNFGSNDFTIDCWVKNNNDGSANARFLGQSDSGSTVGTDYSFRLAWNTTSGGRWQGIIYSGSTTYTSFKSFTSDFFWHHFAIIRYNNILTTYIDGASGAGVDVTGVTINSSTKKLSIGRSGETAGLPWNGWIDEVRISKGIARWVSDFTPPSTAYPFYPILSSMWFK